MRSRETLEGCLGSPRGLSCLKPDCWFLLLIKLSNSVGNTRRRQAQAVCGPGKERATWTHCAIVDQRFDRESLAGKLQILNYKLVSDANFKSMLASLSVLFYLELPHWWLSTWSWPVHLLRNSRLRGTNCALLRMPSGCLHCPNHGTWSGTLWW